MEYRALRIVRSLDKVYKAPKGRRKVQLQPLAEEDVIQLALLQARWRQLVNDVVARCRNGDAVDARCVRERLKNIEEKPYVNFAKELALLGWVPKKLTKRWKTPIYLGADIGRNKYEVYIDLDGRRVAIRIPTLPYTYIVQLGEKEAEWIRRRFKEDAEFAHIALIWIDPRRYTLNIVLPFRREPPKLQPRRFLVVDVNAVYNGVAYAVVEEERVLERSVLRPPLSALGRVNAEARRLQRICSKEGRLCERHRATKSKFYRILREFEKNAVTKLIRLALQYKAAIVVDSPKWDSLKKLKEEGNLGVRKQFLNVGRLPKRLRRLAAWYGVPYAEERLYSSYCPKCNTKLNELNGRKMRCPQCGFEEERDRVPIYWAQKRYREVMAKVSAQATAIASSQKPPSFSPVLAVAAAVS
ncbi:MAG: zinc ribbon domain-containing protein [Pyrobaculum sp.]